MALNELINQVVDIQIRNITSNTYSRDLNTILVLSKHDVFTLPETYRVYQDSNSMLEDGFTTDSYAYNAVRLIFSQEITPVNVVVGRVSTSAANAAYLTAFNQLLLISQGWLWLISDLRDVDTQVELAGLVEVNDKMYCAATHSADALLQNSTTDLASKIKALSYSHTLVWYDKELDNSGGGEICCDGATDTIALTCSTSAPTRLYSVKVNDVFILENHSTNSFSLLNNIDAVDSRFSAGYDSAYTIYLSATDTGTFRIEITSTTTTSDYGVASVNTNPTLNVTSESITACLVSE